MSARRRTPWATAAAARTHALVLGVHVARREQLVAQLRVDALCREDEEREEARLVAAREPLVAHERAHCCLDGLGARVLARRVAAAHKRLLNLEQLVEVAVLELLDDGLLHAVVQRELFVDELLVAHERRHELAQVADLARVELLAPRVARVGRPHAVVDGVDHSAHVLVAQVAPHGVRLVEEHLRGLGLCIR